MRVSGSGFVEMFSDDARRPTTNAAPSPAEVLRAETLAPGRSEGGNDPGASDEMKCSTTTDAPGLRSVAPICEHGVFSSAQPVPQISHLIGNLLGPS